MPSGLTLLESRGLWEGQGACEQDSPWGSPEESRALEKGALGSHLPHLPGKAACGLVRGSP